MLADDETPAPTGRAGQQPGGAEVAVADPHGGRLGPPQDGRGEGPLLGVGVLARDGVHHQPARRLEQHHGLPRQSPGPGPPERPQAVLGARQVAAVDHPHPVPRHRVRTTRCQSRDDRAESGGGVPHQGRPESGLGACDLGVHRLARHPEISRPLADGGVQGRLDAAHDQPHQIDELREQQLAGVLPLGVFGEQGIDGLGREGMLERRTGHHADRGFGREPIEHLAEEHGRPSVSGRTTGATNRLRLPSACTQGWSKVA